MALEPLSLRLTGRPCVVMPVGSVLKLIDKDAALLALVALEPHIASTRAAALLWPQANRQRALGTLLRISVVLTNQFDALPASVRRTTLNGQ